MKSKFAWLCLFLVLFPLIAFAASEVVVADVENGIWKYENDTLKINITRHEDKTVPLVWFEAELFCSPQNPLMPVVENPEKKTSWFHHPETLARGNKLIFAVNDDYYGDRQYNKETVGIIVRNGKLLNYKTHANNSKRFPNLDTMALLADGSLRVFQSRELNVTEYFEMGATDVFSFGPILIRDGIINSELESRQLETEPRVGFGMIEPYHYICVVTEGRHEKSKGTSCLWLAEKLHSLGVVEALNFDGGQTAALVFMGEKINQTGSYNKRSRIRNLSSMLGAGQSDLVPAIEVEDK